MQPLGESSVNVPAFLGKLWNMVNDPGTDHLISWSAAGNSFIIQNQAQFWYELLPLYYKHNNMSSFVRQLNMYGFHKVSTVENGTMDADKDEIQFYHPCFQKDQAELLKNIKRKVTHHKVGDVNNPSNVKSDDLAKVLSDMKQLKGRQISVDSQLAEMKQENAVLWRELALLRQKHLKQQQIVNKLIQFLVTLVQPSASARMGVGVKRRMPLMLHESPTSKKSKLRKQNLNINMNNNAESGPTIHELDNELEIAPQLFTTEDVEELPLVNSPVTPGTASAPASVQSNKEANSPQPAPSVTLEDIASDTISPDLLWDKPDFVDVNPTTVEELILPDELPDDSIINALQPEINPDESQNNEKVFLNPSSRDTLLSNLVNGSYNSNLLNIKEMNDLKNNGTVKQVNTTDSTNTKDVTNSEEQLNNDMTVATRDLRINSGTLCTNDFSSEDLDGHLESMQSEIDQLKELLNGYSSFDANALLGLFNDEAPGYGLSYQPDKEQPSETADPLVSGSELATTGANLIDFNELFDDSLDNQEINVPLNPTVSDDTDSINTPLIIKNEPIFPSPS